MFCCFLLASILSATSSLGNFSLSQHSPVTVLENLHPQRVPHAPYSHLLSSSSSCYCIASLASGWPMTFPFSHLQYQQFPALSAHVTGAQWGQLEPQVLLLPAPLQPWSSIAACSKWAPRSSNEVALACLARATCPSPQGTVMFAARWNALLPSLTCLLTWGLVPLHHLFHRQVCIGHQILEHPSGWRTPKATGMLFFQLVHLTFPMNPII